MTASGRDLLRLLDQVGEGVYFTDLQRRITFWNKAAERISGYHAREVLGRGCAANILIHVDDRGRQLCLGGCPLARTLQDRRRRRADVFLHHREGHRVPVRVRVFPLLDENGKVCGAAELFVDTSEKPALEERLQRLERMAMNDRLTGVANRRYCEIFLQARMEEFRRLRWPLGIVFFDIDDFKNVNDRHSHRVGDLVLKTVARTLRHNVRAIDLVGRWGGEEFLVVLRSTDLRNLKLIAGKLRVLVERSLLIEQGKPVRVTVSGGATLARAGDTVTGLVERADLLMYKAKKAGKNRVASSR
ncbi:MAG: sensor domain-containing diguanylate cyclase [Acidobacteria bacterium]|jgi:diguanylate cyclase (GGDEF)-like protein/PAS domain S-box-containing protein|nr:sensor domain-containing diguanylate cyclase [Acidobacteriota bacterium]